MTIPKLALIPSGYSDGKVFSALPTSGDGDFDFSRGSNATRVNKDGLIETIPLELGSEILSDLDLTNWTVSGSASSVNSDGFTTTTAGGLKKYNLLTVGKDYKALISGTTTSADTQIRSYDNTTTYFNWDSSGSFSFEFTFTATDTGIYIRHSGVGTVGVVNFSVKEVLSGLDTPRLDYSDSSCPSLLLEPQRTNLVTYSEDFTQWNNNGVTLTNGQLAPDGTLNATKVSGVIGSSIMNLLNVNSTDSRSIYARTVSGTGVAKLMSYFGNTNNTFTLTEEWQRFELTSSSSTGGANFYIDFRDIIDQTLSEFIIWGAQSEQGSYATSYIPTNGAIATRYADECNSAGNTDTFNDSEGVLMAEISNISENQTTTVAFSLSDGSTSNTVSVYYFGTSGLYYDIFNSDGTRSGNTPMTKIQQTHNNKISLKYKSGDIALWVNGFEVDTNVGTLSLNGLSELSFDYGNGNFPFYGSAKQLQYFDSALTDSEIEELTSWESFLDMAAGQNYTIK